MRRLLAVLTLFLLAASGVASAATTFKIATTAPEGTAWMEAMRRAADEAAGKTEGRVQFAFYPGGVMGNDKSVLRKIRVGQLQGGALTAGGLTDIHPDLGVYGLPFNFRSYAEADYVRGKMDAGLLEALRKNGFVCYGLTENGFAYLMSGHPARRVEDLKGHKVWVPEGDPISTAAFQAVGVSPVALPLTDVLTGLQTGLVDTIGASAVGAIALQWHTRVKYLTDTPLSYLSGGLVIDRKAFEKLSPGDQATVRAILERSSADLNRQSRDDNQRALAALRKQGIEFIQPSRDDIASWAGPVGQAMERLAGQSGSFSPEILKTLRRHVADYRAVHRGP